MAGQVKTFNCIICPLGCRLTVKIDEGRVRAVEGNSCQYGEEYAREEATAPRRTLTATVRITGGHLPLLPVVSERPLPKDKLLECAASLRMVETAAPVRAGDTIVADILGLGVNMVASRSVEKCDER